MLNNYYENQRGEEPRPAQPVESVAAPSEQSTIPQENSQSSTNTKNQSTPNTSSGQLVVRVFTANQVYPVVGADVTIETNDDENRQALGTSVTDRSGSTTIFTLPAPSNTVSQEPTTLLPFSQYRVTIKHPDFFDAVIENVQIFGGVLSQLPVNLIPIPEIPKGEPTKVVIIPNQNL